MTVIIYKDNALYSDSRYIDDTQIVPISDPKVTRLKNGIIYGSAGTSDDRALLNLLSKIKGNKNIPLPEKIKEINADVDAIFILPSGQAYCIWVERKDADVIQATVNKINAPFFALGSGGKYAIGAMENGASPEEAISIACKWDSGCALPIQKITLK